MKKSLLKIISFFYPIYKKYQTYRSGIVEVGWFNGRKILNSKNTNYSYGSLLRILKFGLTKVKLNKVENVLLLGLGGGSIIKSLRKDFGYSGKITAVEIDAAIIKIAKNEFEIITDENLEIIESDCKDFLRINKMKFDLIIIDVFIDKKVPSFVYEIRFWDKIIKTLSEEGQFVFNAGINISNENKRLMIIRKQFRDSFRIKIFQKVEKINTLMIGVKNL
jgi:precorrin-6B methylase 2